MPHRLSDACEPRASNHETDLHPGLPSDNVQLHNGVGPVPIFRRDLLQSSCGNSSVGAMLSLPFPNSPCRWWFRLYEPEKVDPRQNYKFVAGDLQHPFRESRNPMAGVRTCMFCGEVPCLAGPRVGVTADADESRARAGLRLGSCC